MASEDSRDSDSKGTSPDHASPWLVELAVRQTATQAERLWAWMRTLFCGFAFAVFTSNATFFHPPTLTQISAELLTLTLAVSFSALVLTRTRTQLATRRLHWISAGVDALLVGLALSSNLFTADGSYHGILMSLDVAAAPLVVTTSLVRVDARAVAVSSGSVALLVAAILFWDANMGMPIPKDKLLLLGLYLAGSTFLAYFATRWLRVTVEQAALKAARAERARGGLMTLLNDRHNLRSTLTELRLNSDRLVLELTKRDELAHVGEIAGSVQRAAERIGMNVHDSQVHALAWLDQTAEAAAADFDEAFTRAATRVERSFPEFKIVLPRRESAPLVLIGGGTTGLAQILESVFQNAAEGREGARASAVSVELKLASRGRVIADIVDDGPGLPENLSTHLGKRGYSTKPGSLGLGLWLAHSAMIAAGGKLELIPVKSGAHIRLLFQTALER